ncbi:hypothetical protein SteCoe_9583 [Stentor coeruleus]|uniref:Uncharacterized protein n=1 Tax=Stentor coeruleus TaxID=5963 RepID=A0A1R2CHN0_9CILI|nr:hypothetical protein SteCoe_9583 [Stentor coeruleus]
MHFSNMLENSFENIFHSNPKCSQDLQYWRDKIEKNIQKHSSRDHSRHKSCDVYKLNQLNTRLHMLCSEHNKIKKTIETQENMLKIYKTIDQSEECTQSSNFSTPVSNKNQKNNNDMYLVTFGPGANWSESAKAKRSFPRDVFTCRKLF